METKALRLIVEVTARLREARIALAARRQQFGAERDIPTSRMAKSRTER